LAGIMAFLDRHAHGHGGKLVLFCFDDATYEELEEKLDQCDNEDEVQKFYDDLKKESAQCVFAEIDVDSLRTVRTETR
jgi:hypothetical protein